MTRLSDPKSYGYAPYQDRPRITWPGGARIAFWVAPNIEFYELAPPPSPTRTVWYRWTAPQSGTIVITLAN